MYIYLSVSTLNLSFHGLKQAAFYSDSELNSLQLEIVSLITSTVPLHTHLPSPFLLPSFPPSFPPLSAAVSLVSSFCQRSFHKEFPSG